MRASGDDTPRETPAAKGSDSHISVAPPAWEPPPPPSTNAHPAWMNETTRRERRMGDPSAVTRTDRRVVGVKVHGAVAAVFVLALAALVLGTMLMVFVFAMGVGVAIALATVVAATVLMAGRVIVRRLRGHP